MLHEVEGVQAATGGSQPADLLSLAEVSPDLTDADADLKDLGAQVRVGEVITKQSASFRQPRQCDIEGLSLTLHVTEIPRSHPIGHGDVRDCLGRIQITDG
ncbi:hypothetical protein A6A28_16820 [Streptomyces sp. CB03578]|nr:hypothetical protein A6A28_16820 [Streptomyces sp. CB03578]